MTDLRKAAEMALEMFDWLERRSMYQDLQMKETHEALRQALDLQTAIEKGTKAWADVPDATDWVEELRGNDTPEVIPEVTPEVNEPEGWVKIDEARQYLDAVGCATIYKTAGEDRVPLYSAPQREWVGLTDEDIDSYALDIGVTANKAPPWLVKYARDVEAKLKEKNT